MELSKAGTPCCLSDMFDSSFIVKQLSNNGMQATVAQEKVQLYQKAALKLITDGVAKTTPCRALWVPGRLEVMGKHTDYCGGRSLLGAVSKGFAAIAVDREDGDCKIFTEDLSERARSVCLQVDPEPFKSRLLEPWMKYPAAVIRRLARNFAISKGVTVAMNCDLPPAAGMSSSSAVICLFFMVLAKRNELLTSTLFQKNIKTPEDLYEYLGTIENGQDFHELPGDSGVGTFGGSEDHTGIMSSEPMKLKLFSFSPTNHETTIAFPKHLCFVIGVSNHIARKGGEALGLFNNQSMLAQNALAAYNTSANSSCKSLHEVVLELQTASVASPLKHVCGLLGQIDNGHEYPKDQKSKHSGGHLVQRFTQFYYESFVYIPRFVQGLQEDNMDMLRKAATESHLLSETHLQNIVPSIRSLYEEALAAGAIAASAFGAGFGGSVWAMIEVAKVGDFKERWSSGLARVSQKAEFFVMQPGPGAFFL